MTFSRMNSQGMVEVGFQRRAHLPPKLMEISADITCGGNLHLLSITTRKALYLLFLM